jgi:hypothetical protein
MKKKIGMKKLKKKNKETDLLRLRYFSISFSYLFPKFSWINFHVIGYD